MLKAECGFVHELEIVGPKAFDSNDLKDV